MIDPNDLLNAKFEKKMGGYKATDVDGYMVEVASLISRQTREIAEQKRRFEAAQQKIAEYESDQNSLKEALLSAQRLADSIVRDARAKAEKMEKDAAGKANSLIGEIRDEIIAEQEKLVQVKQEVSSFRSALLNMYRAHLELINDMPVFHEEEPAQPEPQAEPEPEPEPEAEETETAQQMHTQAAAAEAETAGEEQQTVLPEPDAGAGEPGESVPELKLNVRFDEEAGEYVPLSAGAEKGHGGYNGRRR